MEKQLVLNHLHSGSGADAGVWAGVSRAYIEWVAARDPRHHRLLAW